MNLKPTTGTLVAPGDPRLGKLTTKQRLFVFEYLVDLNATKAAERAGYSRKTARSIGQENLTKPDILAEIAEQQSRRFQRLEITADAVLQEIAKIAFSNMLDYVNISPTGEARVDLSGLTREQAAAISDLTVEEFMERTGDGEDGLEKVKRTRFKLSNELAALVDLGKHLKLFTEKVEIEDATTVEAQDTRQKLYAKLQLIRPSLFNGTGTEGRGLSS